MARMTPEQAEIFYQRVIALLDEFCEAEQTPVHSQAYRLFLTLFPVRRYPEAAERP